MKMQLLKCSINPNAQLEESCQDNNKRSDLLDELFQLLKGNEVDVDTNKADPTSMLLYASLYYKKDNFIDLVKLLIQRGADLKAKAEDNNNQTPLHNVWFFYTHDNLIDIIKLLIENNADVKAKEIIDLIRKINT